ncbi:MAG: hypothetical protein H7Y13_12700 [Sphingobacteriaceae bacterium]|nr:hypothetical protein [Sphingobacteriaceae bacterium]
MGEEIDFMDHVRLNTRWKLVSFLCLILIGMVISCEKEKVVVPNGNEIVSLVFNMGAISALNKEKKEVVVDIADFIDRTKLVAIFQLSEGATATVNNTPQYSSETPNDFTLPVTYTVTAANGQVANWTIKLQSNNQRIGLGSVVTEEKRLVKPYEWYVSQDTSGTSSKVNGGAACISMALKWTNVLKFSSSDISEIRRTSIEVFPLQARDPGYLFTPECVAFYLGLKNVFHKIITLSPDPFDVTEQIDKGNLVIMLVDFAKIPFNTLGYQYTNRFYTLPDKTIPTTGHWIVIKGYKRVDGNLFYETYDPYSKGEKYENGEPKGKNRYYYSQSISSGINGQNGWPYAFVIDKKQTVSNEVLRNEVYLPYFQIPLPELPVLMPPKLGTYVKIAFGY